MFTTYDTANAYLGAKTRRPLPSMRATDVHRTADDAIALRYHETDVIVYRADGSYTFTSGGWRTATTKERINAFSPARIWQRGGIWYTAAGPFTDGAQLQADGTWRGIEQGEAQRQKDVRAAIAKYVKGFAAAIKAGTIARPGGGDCWGCWFRETTGDRRADTFPMLGAEHLIEHFSEAYYVPSLLMRAIEWRGYSNPAVIWMMDVERRESAAVCRALRAFLVHVLLSGGGAK